MLPTLTQIIKGESPWIVEGLLPKGQSVILSGSDAKATSLLAVQIALAIAGGKELFGYETSASKILFLDSDKARIRRDAVTLSAKASVTDNISVGPQSRPD
jgi:RecA-family ATPase